MGKIVIKKPTKNFFLLTSEGGKFEDAQFSRKEAIREAKSRSRSKKKDITVFKEVAKVDYQKTNKMDRMKPMKRKKKKDNMGFDDPTSVFI